MPAHEQDIRYRNSPYENEEDRNPRTIDDPRYRTTRYPGFSGGSKDKNDNIFFGQGTALNNFRADQEAESRRSSAAAASQKIIDEDARQNETDFGPADGQHKGMAGTVPNTYQQSDYMAESQTAPAAIYGGFKQQGGSETMFDPSGEGSTFFQPKLASSPELQNEGERQKAAIGKVWEDVKRNPLDFSQANPALGTIRVGEQLLGRVICTELMRKKLLSQELWRDDIEYTRRLSPTMVRGYHFWAIPYVRLMRRSNLATRIIYYPALWRAEELSYQLGHRKKGNIKGKIFRSFIEPLSYIVGLFCKTQDFMSLYREDKSCET